MRRFLTTRYFTSCLLRARRISAISFTLRPRYSETISVRAAAISSRSSATASRLASVGMGHSCSSARGRRARWAPIVGSDSPLRRPRPLDREQPPFAGAQPTRRRSGTGLPRRARRRPRSPSGRSGPVRRIKSRPSTQGSAARGRRLSWRVGLCGSVTRLSTVTTVAGEPGGRGLCRSGGEDGRAHRPGCPGPSCWRS
jgi:hypothetical protein